MFDVSFTEMLVIAVVALVVIGPERLPKVARTVGHLLGRAQRYVSDVKGDIRREMELDELRNLRSEMEDAARTIKSTVDSNVEDMRKEMDQTTREVRHLADDAAHSAAVAEVAADVATHGDSALLPEAAAGTDGHAAFANPANAAAASSASDHAVAGAPHVGGLPSAVTPAAPTAAPHVAGLPPYTPPAAPHVGGLPPGAPVVTPDPIVTLTPAHASASAPAPASDTGVIPQASLFPTDVLPPGAPAVASAPGDTHPDADIPARDREKA